MQNRKRWLGAAAVLACAATAGAQQPGAAAPAQALPIPAVGDMAPDFAFRGITRDGMMEKPANLSDYRGQTVVLWFFIKARTRG